MGSKREREASCFGWSPLILFPANPLYSSLGAGLRKRRALWHLGTDILLVWLLIEDGRIIGVATGMCYCCYRGIRVCNLSDTVLAGLRLIWLLPVDSDESDLACHMGCLWLLVTVGCVLCSGKLWPCSVFTPTVTGTFLLVWHRFTHLMQHGCVVLLW